MIDKTVKTLADAVAGLKDGSTLLVAGFGGAGQPADDRKSTKPTAAMRGRHKNRQLLLVALNQKSKKKIKAPRLKFENRGTELTRGDRLNCRS
jgi:hypothetical protein